MANGVKPEKREEESRRHVQKDLESVGENLPDEFHGVEGSDVREVVRHRKRDSDVVEESVDEKRTASDVPSLGADE